MTGRRVDPPGTTPWDRWHAARIGGFTAAFLTVLPAIWIDGYPFWVIVIGAAIGGGVGYFVGRRAS